MHQLKLLIHWEKEETALFIVVMAGIELPKFLPSPKLCLIPISELLRD